MYRTLEEGEGGGGRRGREAGGGEKGKRELAVQVLPRVAKILEWVDKGGGAFVQDFP